MYKLIYFIRRTFVAVIFIVLEIAAIRYYAYSTPYTQARLLTLSNGVVGAADGLFNNIGEYFSLRRENIRLTARVAELENRLDAYRGIMPAETDSLAPHTFEYMPARVISNSVNRARNFITLDKGFADGVCIDMAVLSPEGFAVGYVVNCSENYSVAMTLLNTDFKTGGKLADDGNFGSIHWGGGNPHIVDFDEVPKYAEVKAGDMVTTTGFSYYFPADVPIGVVEEYTLNPTRTTYDIRVRLSADMPRLYNVILVNNTASGELRTLDTENPSPAADRPADTEMKE